MNDNFERGIPVNNACILIHFAIWDNSSFLGFYNIEEQQQILSYMLLLVSHKYPFGGDLKLTPIGMPTYRKFLS